jgi:hypothetical protein
MMSSKLKILCFILLVLWAPACTRSTSSQPGADPTQPLKSIGSGIPITQTGVQPTPAQQTLSPAPEMAEITLTAEVTPNLAPVPAGTLMALRDLPLRVGNAWVYDYQAYSGDQKAHWQVADTVIAVEEYSPYVAGQIDRVVTLISGSPGKDFIDPPVNMNWWMVLGDGKVFHQDILDWNKVEQSPLDLVLPLPGNTPCWFVDAGQRKNFPESGKPGCRSASPLKTVNMNSGTFIGCFDLVTPYNNGLTRTTFCPGIGFIAEKFDHQGTLYGYEYSMRAYVLQ